MNAPRDPVPGATMLAAAYRRPGPAADVLTLERLPVPEPGPGEVRVRLRASGVNPSDVGFRSGRFPVPEPFPVTIPHSDGAGIVEAVGPGVPGARVGERVWLWNAQWRRPFGTAAEHAVVPGGQAVRLPDGTGFDEGACFGVPLLTAWRAVALGGDLAGRRVMVSGGAGSVGHYAVQLAKARGATVIATASGARKAEHARSAGADHVIDYRAEDVPARVAEVTGGRGVDHLVDVDLATEGPLLADLLAPFGTAAVYASRVPEATIPAARLLWTSATLSFVLVYELPPEVRGAAVAELTALLEAGALRHTIGMRLPLGRIAEAHDAVAGGQVMGNVVVTIG